MEDNSRKVSFLQQTWVRHTSIVLGIFLILFVGVRVLRFTARKTGNEMLKVLKLELSLDAAANQDMTVKTARQMKMLQELFDMAKSRRDHNRAVFMQMYEFHFASTTVLLILSAIASVLVLLVAQNGVANANPYLKSVFYTVAFITAFYAVVPAVYDHEQSVETNLELYKNYEQLRYEIYYYAMILPDAEEAAKLQEFTEFYTQLVEEMRGLVNIGIKFSSESIKVPELLGEEF